MNLYRMKFASGEIVCDVYAISPGAALINALNTLGWPACLRGTLHAVREEDIKDETFRKACFTYNCSNLWEIIGARRMWERCWQVARDEMTYHQLQAYEFRESVMSYVMLDC